MSKLQQKFPVAFALICILLLIIGFFGFSKLLDSNQHESILSPSWTENSFETNWTVDVSQPVSYNLSFSNNELKISTEGLVPLGTLVSAQRESNLSFNMSESKYLKVSILTSSINVAARIVLWSNSSNPVTVLAKTYNDKMWHTEIIDLSYFELTDKPFKIELGLMKITDSTADDSVSFRQLSFNTLEWTSG